jgi:hypothetical protein
MAELLGAVTTATKFFFEVNQISIDNWTFKLFYKATTSILIACSLLSGTKQFFGEPINCDVRGGGVDGGVLNSYCWMYSSFKIPPDFKGHCSKRDHYGEELYNTYYQWVAIFLVCQALLIYIPRVVWLSMEGGLMKFLVRNARGKIVEGAQEKRDQLIQTFKVHLHNKYTKYAFLFFLCELLNLFVVVFIVFLIDRFLNYSFLGYGYGVWRYYSLPHEERRFLEFNPMCEVFPRVASCDYKRYGPGGGQETKNALCVLGLNMINDKIFMILWFWYGFLILMGLFRTIDRVAQVLSWRFRYQLIKWKIRRYFVKTENDEPVRYYVEHCSLGDWLVLYQMARNMNKRFFAEFIYVLARKVNPHSEGDSEGEETHKTMLEEGGNKEKAFTGICETMADQLDITMIDDDNDEKQDKAIITKSDALDVFA